MMETKNNYKLTEVGKIPVEWNIARMDSLGSTYGGLSGKTKADFENGNKNFVSYKQIFNNPLLKNQEFETVSISEDERQNEVNYGDVLFTTSSETPDEVAMSSIFLIEGASKYFLNSFSFGYRFNQLDSIDPEYYGYYFRGEYFRRLTFKLSQGSTRYNISKNKLVEEYIHVPPLKEQQKIAEILSTVDEQIEQTDQLIGKTKELKKGLTQQLLVKGIGHTKFKQSEIGKIPVEWEVKQLEEIADVKGGKRLPKGKSLVKENTGFPYIRVSDMEGGCVSLNNIQYVPKEVAPKISNYRIYAGELFISVAGTLGIVGDVPVQLDGANLTENANRICNITINRLYLKYLLTSSLIQNEIDKVKTTSAQPKLALTRIKKFLITVPSLIEQQKIAEILSSVDEDIQGYEEEKSKYEKLKTGLMQQLLTGKRRVKV